MHAAGYGCTVRLLRRLVELGGDVRLHDNNGLMVGNWASRQINVCRRSKNLDYLLYTQNRALTSVGRPPIDEQASSAMPCLMVSTHRRPLRSSSAYVTTCIQYIVTHDHSRLKAGIAEASCDCVQSSALCFVSEC